MNLDQAQQAIAAQQARLNEHGIDFRIAPPVPTTCCGKGCQGCVWEGYFAAVAFWLDDGQIALAKA